MNYRKLPSEDAQKTTIHALHNSLDYGIDILNTLDHSTLTKDVLVQQDDYSGCRDNSLKSNPSKGTTA